MIRWCCCWRCCPERVGEAAQCGGRLRQALPRVAAARAERLHHPGARMARAQSLYQKLPQHHQLAQQRAAGGWSQQKMWEGAGAWCPEARPPHEVQRCYRRPGAAEGAWHVPGR